MIGTAHPWDDTYHCGEARDIFKKLIETGCIGREEAMKCITENIKRYND